MMDQGRSNRFDASATHPTCLVLDHAVDQAVLDKQLRDLGWLRCDTLPPVEQQPDDDRLIGLWQGPEGAYLELVYDGFIHWLELRDCPPDAGQRVANVVPSLDADAVVGLLRDPRQRRVIAGIRAASRLGDPALALHLGGLQHHADDAVRFEAAAAIQALVPTLVVHGGEVLRRGFRHRAGAHPMWGMMEPAWFRRQTLRWLLADNPRPTPGVESVLRGALQDPDWEVRAGALIGAVRYRLKGLGGLVETCPLPRVSRNGPDSADRAMLRGLQRVGCALLAGRRPPRLGMTASPKARALDRLAKLLGPVKVEPDDHADLLVYALTTPIEPGEESAVLHPGMSADEEGPYLDTLRLIQIPDSFSWLNSETGEGVRRVYGGGFLIAREPVGGVDDPQPMTMASAQDWCRRHSSEALGLRFPTVEKWILAVRGNDGRRFPWGNGHQQDSPTTPGPRGTFGHGSLGEWAMDAAGSPVHCGPRCGELREGRGPALLRPLVEVAAGARDGQGM